MPDDLRPLPAGAIGNRRAVAAAGPDYYPTPAWAVRALLSQESFEGTVSEPCCGGGDLARALAAGGLRVTASDLFDYGFGPAGIDAVTLAGPCDNIVTNPPYNLAEPMLARFLAICTGKVALLLRLSFLESKRRHPLFQRCPPARVYVFSERLSLAPRGTTVAGGGTISYGWFVWDPAQTGETRLRWLPLGFKTPGMV